MALGGLSLSGILVCEVGSELVANAVRTNLDFSVYHIRTFLLYLSTCTGRYHYSFVRKYTSVHSVWCNGRVSICMFM